MEKIRIAIAEDHTIVRKGYVAMLEADGGFEVVADAVNGAELISMLASAPIQPVVCLLDVNMPVMNGYETLSALKDIYPDLRFLVLTQLEEEWIVVRMLKAGASGYMLKSMEPEELKRAIRTVAQADYFSNDLVKGRLINLVRKGEEYNKLALTEREETFLKWCCSELTYKEIADRMDITERTAAFYRQTLFDKLKAKSRTGLALYALRLGFVPLEDLK